MPSSEPTNISLVVQLLRNYRTAFQTILDVGPGCGKYGLLIREYLDGHWTGRGFHTPERWYYQLDCVEAFPAYITDAHRFLYNCIYLGPLQDQTLPNYDMLFFGDSIEHFDKDWIVKWLLNRRDKLLFISTPARVTNGSQPFGNKYEHHLSMWYQEDFARLGSVVEYNNDGILQTVVVERT